MPTVQRSILACTLPPTALLRKYLGIRAHVDSYVTEIAAPVALAEYVEAFYTTDVFKLERWILSWAVDKPSSDPEARRLAQGALSSFAAWTVEGREHDQLLMCDMYQRTRSWLMVAPMPAGDGTRLYFGSAVVPVRQKSGETNIGSTYTALMGFHKLYSHILLKAARAKLARR